MSQKINYEAEFCGRVPLHQTNLIQPHGVLLIVERGSLRLIQASENASELFGMPVQESVGRTLEDFLPREQCEKLRHRFDGKVPGKIPFTFRFPSGQRLGIVQAQDGYFVVEVQQPNGSAEGGDTFLELYQELKYVMAAVESAGSVAETCEIALRELKQFSGFDKLMIYRFDEDWNGDVIAEVKEAGMDTYLGLKFPASDIPKQARELYRKTPYRLIPNIDYTPVRLFPVINPLTGGFTDLSDSNLRSVAGVHIEYLRNMGVIASMSTRILVEGKLWGLIACHHRSPKYLSFEMCSVFELLSNVISAKISTVEKQDVFAYRGKMQELYAEMMEEVYRGGSLGQSLAQHEQGLLNLLGASGAAVVMNNRIETLGTAPSPAEVEDLVLWLRSAGEGKLYHQPALSSVFEPAEKYSQIASGILALPIQPDRGSFVLAFRREAVRDVNWGGNPNEAIQFEPDRKNYHPRNSFRLWQQTVRQTSLPWTEEELATAEQFRNFLLDYTLNKAYS